MLKSALILGTLVAISAASTIPANAKSNVVIQVLTPSEMDAFVKEHPQAQPFERHITPTESRVMGQTRDLIIYTLGARQSGDYIVAYDSGKHSWSTPQDVGLTITYPKSGTGAIITHMRIEVDQSNSLGRAYVTAGGIGYRYITCVVEAQSTYWFNWVHNIFGR